MKTTKREAEKKQTHRLTIDLDLSDWQRLRAVAFLREKTLVEVIRELIRSLPDPKQEGRR